MIMSISWTLLTQDILFSNILQLWNIFSLEIFELHDLLNWILYIGSLYATLNLSDFIDIERKDAEPGPDTGVSPWRRGGGWWRRSQHFLYFAAGNAKMQWSPAVLCGAFYLSVCHSTWNSLYFNHSRFRFNPPSLLERFLIFFSSLISVTVTVRV